MNPRRCEIEVTIGVQQPDKVDKAAVAASLPFGQVTVNVVKGGLDVPDKERGGGAVIAMATVAVRLDLEAPRNRVTAPPWTLRIAAVCACVARRRRLPVAVPCNLNRTVRYQSRQSVKPVNAG